MADTLIAGTTLVEKESRSIGDIPIGGIIEWDDTFSSIPEGFVLCDGSTITDPLSSYNGSAVPDLNTNYLSIAGAEWTGVNPDTDAMSHGIADTNQIFMQEGGKNIVCPVNLPHGVTVIACIVDGNAAAENENWELKISDRDSSTGTTMATAAVGTEETTITSATIDNKNSAYGIRILNLDNADAIFGTRITYEPRFKFIIRVR